MAKIIAHFSKKLPLANQSYGMEQFSASVEAELQTGGDENVAAGLRRLVALARQSVDEQFRSSGGTGQPVQAHRQAVAGTAITARFNGGNGNGGNGNGGRKIPATASQKKAIYAICKNLGLDSNQYGAETLSIKEASKLIDSLKAQQAGN